MRLKILKISLGAIFLASSASLGAIIILINPYKASPLFLTAFSVSVFLVFFAAWSWLGLTLRRKFITESNSRRVLKMALREGALLAVLAVGYLWLNHFNLFKVWTAIPFFILIVGAEYYFITQCESTNERE